jgi:hypothetical protein
MLSLAGYHKLLRIPPDGMQSHGVRMSGLRLDRFCVTFARAQAPWLVLIVARPTCSSLWFVVIVAGHCSCSSLWFALIARLIRTVATSSLGGSFTHCGLRPVGAFRVPPKAASLVERCPQTSSRRFGGCTTRAKRPWGTGNPKGPDLS